MIVKISGKLVEKKDQSVIINVKGLFYEVFVPASVLMRLNTEDPLSDVELVTYQYMQISQAAGIPILIGFMNEVEKGFFLNFIKVSGIGPRAAIKALSKPISDITQAIDSGDVKFLTTLPGIGTQRAKEIVAKLQGKIGKYGLIKDQEVFESQKIKLISSEWQDEALSILLQLQYSKNEAVQMIEKALQRNTSLQTSEELLNEIYKQKARD